MLNQITLIGRLTADPELRYTNSGTAVAGFTLAVDRDFKNQDGNKETDFINIVAWQQLGELVAQYLGKGRLAAVSGRLQIRSYENKEGQKVRVAEVVANTVNFLDKGQEAEQAPATQSQSNNKGGNSRGNGRGQSNRGNNNRNQNFNDDDLPF